MFGYDNRVFTGHFRSNFGVDVGAAKRDNCPSGCRVSLHPPNADGELRTDFGFGPNFDVGMKATLTLDLSPDDKYNGSLNLCVHGGSEAYRPLGGLLGHLGTSPDGGFLPAVDLNGKGSVRLVELRKVVDDLSSDSQANSGTAVSARE